MIIRERSSRGVGGAKTFAMAVVFTLVVVRKILRLESRVFGKRGVQESVRQERTEGSERKGRERRDGKGAKESDRKGSVALGTVTDIRLSRPIDFRTIPSDGPV